MQIQFNPNQNLRLFCAYQQVGSNICIEKRSRKTNSMWKNKDDWHYVTSGYRASITMKLILGKKKKKTTQVDQ